MPHEPCTNRLVVILSVRPLRLIVLVDRSCLLRRSQLTEATVPGLEAQSPQQRAHVDGRNDVIGSERLHRACDLVSHEGVEIPLGDIDQHQRLRLPDGNRVDQHPPHAAEFFGAGLALAFEAYSIGGNHRRIRLLGCPAPAGLDPVDDSLPCSAKRIVVGVEFPAAVLSCSNRRSTPPVVGRLGRDGIPLAASRHERDHVFRIHGPAVRIQDAENHALCRPAAWDAVSPHLVEMYHRQRSINGGKWFWRGAIHGRHSLR